MRISLVHDFMVQDGGAERVLRAFCDIWPDAPIFTLVHNPQNAPKSFEGCEIETSFLQKAPFGISKYQWYLPLMPAAIERLDLKNFDVVLSSSSAFAKGIITRPETMHICYCHTPTRYLWTDTLNYIDELKFNPLIKKIVPLFLPNLRIWDKLSATRVDKIIANSRTVQKRIQKYYNRESDVINPPVDAKKFSITDNPDNFYLIGGRLVPYKRYDIAVRTFSKLGIPLKIFGIGPEYKKLKNIAKPNIEFLGKVSEKEKAKLYKKCIAFLHPQEEDFGITALEAMASGKPVIAYKKGGALETVIPGITGEFFDEQIHECLMHTILNFKPENYNPNRIREHAMQFDIENFKARIKHYVEKNWYRHKMSA
ncbi:MAG: glycosyltransferase [Patescibacteria group bacterium]|nr:glycosyltransferase [Patescibacteria group bacterium]